MACRDAALGALDLSLLSSRRLTEHSEKHDPPSRGDEVRDANLLLTEMEAEFTQFATQLARLRLTQVHATLGKKVDSTRCPVEEIDRERVQPSLNLRMNLDLTPFIHERIISPMR
jgi:hypothetical protein